MSQSKEHFVNVPRKIPSRFPNPLPKQTEAVLLMAYGSPATPEDIGPYYTHIRGGRQPRPELVEDLTARYRIIGGISPLTPTTLSLAHKLENRLGVPVYVGMRHAEPFIADTLKQMAEDGVERAVSITLAPHYSKMSIGAYIEAAEDGLKQVEADGHALKIDHIERWSSHPLFVDVIARRVRDAVGRVAPTTAGAVHEASSDGAEPLELPDDCALVFTAHSLPISIREWNDPYEEELENSCRLIAERLGVERWQLAYQSEGSTPDPWLGPDICDVIPQLAQDGMRSVVVCPFGFVSDHLEIYFDIDIEAETVAREAGVTLARTESLNADQEFVQLLAHLVAESATIKVS